jgi:hypothetical protein
MPTRAAVTLEVGKLIAARYPKGPESAGELDGCIAMWLDDLDDLTDADLAAACRTYRRSVEPADRWFPTPGRILALSPIGRALATLGSDDDSARAFVHFGARMRALGFRPSRAIPARHLDEGDPYRNDAMFSALEAFGGPSAWGARDTSDAYRLRESEARWRAAYRAAREAQRQDREAIVYTARMIAAPARLMLGGAA